MAYTYGDDFMNRVMVIGSPGSGKSTLSQHLGRHYKLPVIHLDKHYWLANWTPRDNDSFDQMLEQFASQEQWVIDGNYSRTMDIRLKRAEQVIWLDMPTWLCLYRVFKRRLIYHKKSRPDMNEECQEKLDLAFLKWVWNYRKRSRPATIQKLREGSAHTEVIILKSKAEVAAYIDSLPVE